MGTADLTQDCHTNAHYSTYDQSFADKQKKASYAHGEKAIYECYDDYMRLGGFGLDYAIRFGSLECRFLQPNTPFPSLTKSPIS